MSIFTVTNLTTGTLYLGTKKILRNRTLGVDRLDNYITAALAAGKVSVSPSRVTTSQTFTALVDNTTGTPSVYNYVLEVVSYATANNNAALFAREITKLQNAVDKLNAEVFGQA